MAFEVKELEKTFEKNLKFFGERIPALAEKFKNYKPNAELVIDPEGRVNIYDRKKECFLYPGDGRIITYKQIGEWMQSPQTLTIGNEYLQGPNEWIHIRYINRLIDLKKEVLKTNSIALGGARIPLLLVVGVGLGEHLKFLTENFLIEDLLILEPNEDFFYISLHTVDWEEVLKPLLKNNKLPTASFLVGEEAMDTELIMSFFKAAGPFKTSTAFLYIHYVDSELTQLLKKLAHEVANEISYFGFFDDEIISLKQTLTNIKKGVPLFLPSKELKPKTAAAVVGSGPSLEKLLPYLKKHRNRLFVISCGTALGILEKNGIVPDLHVNIERNDPPYKAVIETTSQEFRRKIDFLGANNNYPPFFEGLFKRSAMYLKAGDAGASLFPFDPLYYVNPTVTNTGLALAHYLGFDRVYLFGVDLAFPGEKHHAKGSAYETLFKDLDLKGDIEVEANFGGKVKTNGLFYSSLRIMEESIKFFSSKNPNFRVYNPNFGAKIEGAQPTEEEKLEKLLSEEKGDPDFKNSYWEKTIKELNRNWFDFPKFKMQLMTNFFQLKGIIENDLLPLEELEDYANAIRDFYSYLRVLREHNYTLFHMLHGTFTIFMAHMYMGLYANAPLETRKEFLKRAKELFKEMLNEMEKEIYNLYSYFPV